MALGLHYRLKSRSMQKENHTGIIPAQHTGEKIDTESVVECNSIAEAKSLYTLAKGRLLDINNWQHLTGKLLAGFQLVNEQGQELNRLVQQGDYCRIDIPGPGSKSGEGYDWVQLEAVDEVADPAIESIGIRARPVANPQNTGSGISHFYSAQSTSNFIVTREGKKVTAGVYDRNVKPNQHTDNVVDKIRHAMAGAGAIAAFSKIQWKQLVDGLLKKG
jgi:hypothetical protein